MISNNMNKYSYQQYEYSLSPSMAVLAKHKCHTWASRDWVRNIGGPKAKADILEIITAATCSTVTRVSAKSRVASMQPPSDSDLVVLQYPTRGLTAPDRDGLMVDFGEFLKMWQSLHQRKVIIVHDLKSVQMKFYTGGKGMLSLQEWEEREVGLFTAASDVISHSVRMSSVIRDQYNFAITRFGELRLFDYLCKTITHNNAIMANLSDIHVAYCGNLHGCALATELLRELPANLRLRYSLFSPGQLAREPTRRSDIFLESEQDADKLPNVLRKNGCKFGLCWWAEEVRSSGYLKLIAPHKASCYLAAEIPLIAPKNTYLGDLVEELGLGVTIDNLAALADAVLPLSPTQFSAMHKRVVQTSQLIRNGHFILSALGRLM